jgi:hypothetical protein
MSTINILGRAACTRRKTIAAAVLVGIAIGALGTILGLGIPVLMERAAADAARHVSTTGGNA